MMLPGLKTTRTKLAASVAAIAMVAGLAASPADAGSRKEKYWLPNGGEASEHRKGKGRKQERSGASSHIAAPVWLPQHGSPSHDNPGRKRDRKAHNAPPPPQFGHRDRRESREGRGGHDRYYTHTPPRFADRDRRHGRHYAPPAPPPWWNHADGRRPRHGDYDYRHNHKPHRRHVEHHVYRYYYYRTSPRNYYYYSHTAPPPAAYPVYFLVPYHIHTEPGYHDHGEQTAYCDSGYADGGYYTGGAYNRGASHEAGATIVGGILGAAVGSQVGDGKGRLVAVGVGTLIGALIGNDVGRSMDRRDRAYATGSFGHAMETAPTCTTIRWNNQQSGNYGTVTPVNTYEPEPGRYCREFQQQVVIGGKMQDAYGTACRQPDGSWEIVAEQP